LKVYVAASITAKPAVIRLFDTLSELGHEVVTDWTKTDDLPEHEREARPDYVGALATRDYEGVRESDAFLLFSKPAEARSMYVELGIALASLEATGRPKIVVIGPAACESVFYYHPRVIRVASIEEALMQLRDTPVSIEDATRREARLEEFRSLRNEMLEIIKERVWGQATYVVLLAGLCALTATVSYRWLVPIATWLGIPFILHLTQREHSRIRMANYIRLVLEPRIPGMYWEAYLALWRGRFGTAEGKGWLRAADRLKHICSFSGLYALIALACWISQLLDATTPQLIIGSSGLIGVFIAYAALYRLYEQGSKELREIRKLDPRG